MQEWESRALAAEATVVVLKRKVKALYNGESTSVVQRQLERSERRQEEARRRRELVEVKAAELAKYSRDLEGQVAERTRALRAIHDNVTSGFLIVTEDLRVAPGFTKSCASLLGTKELAGRDIGHILCGEDTRSAAQLRLALTQVFGDMLPEEVSLDAVPRRFVIGGCALRVDARAIRDEGGVVCQVLLTVNDITSLEQAQREARENMVLIGILRQRESFTSFLADARELMTRARDAIEERDHAFYRRALHTVKGNAAAFELADTVSMIHGIEGQDVITAADVDKVEGELRSFLKRHESVLDITYDSAGDTSFEISERNVEALTALTKPNDVEIRRWTAQVVLKHAGALLGPLDCYVDKLAERLQKQVRFTIVGGNTLVDAPRVRPVMRNLTHLLRNALDHGIEAPEERGDKSATGHVEVRVEDSADAWTLHIVDDGRGIETGALVARAIEQGFVTAEEAAKMSEDEKLALIFRDGLSTAEQASEVSGRGVGMAAVKAAVEAANGTITVKSTVGQGTKVVMRLPKPDALRPSIIPPGIRASHPPMSVAV